MVYLRDDKMLVEIYDLNKRLINVLNGKFKDGAFIYKKDTINIPILNIKFMGTDASLPCDYSKVLDKGKQKVALYKYDGSEYNQIAFGETPNTNINAYLNAREIGSLRKNSMIQKPFLPLKELIEFGLLLLLVIMAGINYYSAQNLGQQAQAGIRPFNKTLALTENVCATAFNQSRQMILITNRTLAILSGNR